MVFWRAFSGERNHEHCKKKLYALKCMEVSGPKQVDNVNDDLLPLKPGPSLPCHTVALVHLTGPCTMADVGSCASRHAQPKPGRSCGSEGGASTISAPPTPTPLPRPHPHPTGAPLLPAAMCVHHRFLGGGPGAAA